MQNILKNETWVYIGNVYQDDFNQYKMVITNYANKFVILYGAFLIKEQRLE